MFSTIRHLPFQNSHKLSAPTLPKNTSSNKPPPLPRPPKRTNQHSTNHPRPTKKQWPIHRLVLRQRPLQRRRPVRLPAPRLQRLQRPPHPPRPPQHHLHGLQHRHPRQQLPDPPHRRQRRRRPRAQVRRGLEPAQRAGLPAGPVPGVPGGEQWRDRERGGVLLLRGWKGDGRGVRGVVGRRGVR